MRGGGKVETQGLGFVAEARLWMCVFGGEVGGGLHGGRRRKP